MKQLLSWELFFLLGFGISFLEASQIPTGQDVGATVRIEKTEKEQKAMMKKLSQKKKKVEVEGEEAIQPKKPAELSKQQGSR